MGNALIPFLQRFHELPEHDRELIESAMQHRIYKEGDPLTQPDRICRELFFITKGILRIVVYNDNAKPVTHYFLKENQFCTILESFEKEIPVAENIQAACDAEVLVIGRQQLLTLYGQIPYLKTLIDQITRQALLDKIRIRNTYLGQDSASRYRLFLQQQSDIALRVSLGDIASYLGITPQSLSRIRKNNH